MFQIIFILVLLFSILFPIVYIFIKKGKNKLLFVAACYGFVFITEFLLYALVSPFIVLDIFFIPELEVSGHFKNLTFLTDISMWLKQYAFLIVLFLNIPISLGVYRKYDFFKWAIIDAYE